MVIILDPGKHKITAHDRKRRTHRQESRQGFTHMYMPCYLFLVCLVLLPSVGCKKSPSDVQKINDGLLRAAHLGSEIQVKSWLYDGADPNARNDRQETALMLAAQKSHSEIAGILIEKGADVNLTDGSHNSALMFAAHSGNIQIIQSLLNKGAEVEVRNLQGNTALIIAVSNGKNAAIKMLLDYSSNPNAVNIHGNTALMIAADRDNEIASKMLLEKGADPKLKNNAGDTAYAIANRNPKSKVLHLLIPNKI